MNAYDDILTFCRSRPDTTLVYLAIGCSQRWHMPPAGSPQGFPPFVANWPGDGSRIIIMIDPDLEDNPHAITVAGYPEQPLADGGIADFGKNAFIAIRRNWHWPHHTVNHEVEPCSRFLHGLCTWATEAQGPHLIVQDYSGPDIRRYFPLYTWHVAARTALINKVVFDVTGKDGGCFVDFSKVTLRRDADGNFIQPAYERLQRLRELRHPALAHEAADRTATLLNYVGRLYRAHRLLDPPRDWYAPEIVAGRIQSLLYIYGLQPGTSTDDLARLFFDGIIDLCMAADNYMDQSDIFSILEGPFDQTRTSLTLLRDIIVAEAAQNQPTS